MIWISDHRWCFSTTKTSIWGLTFNNTKKTYWVNISRKAIHLAWNLSYKASLHFWLKQCQQNNTFSVVTKLNCKVTWEKYFVLHATFTYIGTRYAAEFWLSWKQRDIENCPNIAQIFINVNNFIQFKTACK